MTLLVLTPQAHTEDAKVATKPQHFEVEKERQGEVEKTEKSSTKPASQSESPDKVTWKDNPNDCDLEKQFVRKDNLECIDKPVQQKEPKRTVRTTSVNTVGCEQYRSIVNKYDWNSNVAMAVMKAESGCNPNAANYSDHHGQCVGSFGLMQLACFHTENPKNPSENIRVAYQIYSRQGWQPWGAYTNGSYSKYLN